MTRDFWLWLDLLHKAYKFNICNVNILKATLCLVQAEKHVQVILKKHLLLSGESHA